MDFLKYLEIRYILFALWMTGAIAVAAPLVLPKGWVPLLHLGEGAIGPMPIGFVTLFAFILWIRLMLTPKRRSYIPESLKKEWKGRE